MPNFNFARNHSSSFALILAPKGNDNLLIYWELKYLLKVVDEQHSDFAQQP